MNLVYEIPHGQKNFLIFHFYHETITKTKLNLLPFLAAIFNVKFLMFLPVNEVNDKNFESLPKNKYSIKFSFL
jgi:hypothetical protein